MLRTGIEAFLAMLADAGVRHIFGNPGTTELPLTDALAGRDDFEPDFAPPRAGEVERTALDTSLAAKELGFKA